MKINILSLLENDSSKKLQLKEYSNPYLVSSYSSIWKALQDFNMSTTDLITNCSDFFKFYNNNKVPRELNSWGSYSTAIEFLIKSIREVIQTICQNIDTEIDFFKSVYDTCQNSNEAFYKKDLFLSKMLYKLPIDELETRLPDIEATKCLMDPICPNVSIIADDELYNTIIQICNSLTFKGEIDITEALDKLDSLKSRLCFSILGNTDYSQDNLCSDSLRIAKELFGSNGYNDTEISNGLYGKAVLSIEKIPMIVSYLDDTKAKYIKANNTVEGYLNDLLDTVANSCCLTKSDSKSAKLDINVPPSNNLSKIVTVLQSGVCAIKTVICTTTILFSEKLSRLHSIISTSQQIIDHVQTLYAKYSTDREATVEYVEAEDIPVKESFMSKWLKSNNLPLGNVYDSLVQYNKDINVYNDLKEFFIMQDEFNAEVAALMEDFSGAKDLGLVYKFLLEDENAAAGQQQATGGGDNAGGNTQAAAPQQTATNTAQTSSNQQATPTQQQPNQPQNNAANNAKEANAEKTTMSWLDKLLQKFSEIFTSYKSRITELIIKNGPEKAFWEKNKNGLKQMNNAILQIEVNDYYKFNLDALQKSDNLVDFNISQDYMKSDADLQNALIQKISGGQKVPDLDEKSDSFAQKITKIYQGGKVVSTEDGKKQKLQQLDFKPDLVFAYVDGLQTKGFNSPAIGGLDAEFKKVDQIRKNVKASYKKYLDELRSKIPDAQPETAATTATNAQPTDQQQTTNASAIFNSKRLSSLRDQDFKFNLARHFGLNEIDIQVNNDTITAAEKNGLRQGSNSSTVATLDAMIKRYFNCSTTVLSTKMTCSVAAYKQYMSLYKAVINQKQQNTENAQQ